MHETTSIFQDIKVSMMLPLAFSMLSFFWLAWYALFDAAAFDETISKGVDFDELNNIWGIFANVSAQAVYLNVYLVALHLIIPIFPLSGASFFAACLAGQGLGLRQSARFMDLLGCLMSLLLMVVGLQQTFFDDTNGIGIFVFFNAMILMTLSFKRRCLDSLQDHDLVCRSCYIEKENCEVESTELPDNTVSSSENTTESITIKEDKELEIV